MLRRIGVAVFACCFAVSLLPNWFSRVGVHSAFFVYRLTIPLVLIALVVLAFRSSTRRMSIASLTIFAALFVFNLAYKRGLPQGSFIARFDRNAWSAPNATRGSCDISTRQKMLGDLVRHVLPGRARYEIEALLGPSSALTYMLGPERTFFAIEAEFLYIELDESGRFQRYTLGIN